MGLRTKILLIIFVFQVLVFGFLTVLFAVEETGRAHREAQRDSRLIEHLFTAWIKVATSADWQIRWGELERRLQENEWIERGGVAVVPEQGPIVPRIARDEKSHELLVRDLAMLQRAAVTGTETRGRTIVVRAPVLNSTDKLLLYVQLRPDASTGYAPALPGLIIAMAIGTIVLLLITYMYLNRLVLRPLDAMIEASGRVAMGGIVQKVPEAVADDEMATLVRTFNVMMDRMQQYQRQLEEDVRKAQSKITHTERRLFHAQRLSTTGTLAAGIAHEINNPLGGMMNAARMIREGRLDPERQKQYLDLIVEGLDRIRTIVQQVLQFRPKPFEVQPVALREVAEKAVAFLEHRAKAKGAEVRNEVPPDLAPVNGDPLELQQALLNILMNAVDACVLNEGMITVYARAEGGAVRLSVADNGSGMDEEQLAQCMDPFFTTKEVGKGTGLGLSVANNILQNHGGRIEIQSSKGSGTTVGLILPASAPKPAAPAPSGAVHQ
jgi:signal transduction histidine kinase